MTQKEFIKVLDWKEYSYGIEGDKIVVTEEDQDIFLSYTSLPPDVVFNNVRDVFLDSLTSLPPGVVFKNGGRVYLQSLTSLPPDVVFYNRGYVDLRSLVGGWFNEWEGNIEGIDSKRLLNFMISKGMFI